LLLRANEQEVENHEDGDHRQEGHKIAAEGRGRRRGRALGVRRSDHEVDQHVHSSETWVLSGTLIDIGRAGPAPGPGGSRESVANRLFYHAVAPELQRPGIERLRPYRLAQLTRETKVVVEVVN